VEPFSRGSSAGLRQPEMWRPCAFLAAILPPYISAVFLQVYGGNVMKLISLIVSQFFAQGGELRCATSAVGSHG